MRSKDVIANNKPYYRQILLYASEIGWRPRVKWLHSLRLPGRVRIRFTRTGGRGDAETRGFLDVIIPIEDDDAWYKVAHILHRMAQSMDRGDTPADLDRQMRAMGSKTDTPS